MEINRSNYEIWLIDWLDGNLGPLQVEKLQLFLDENPDIKKESEDLLTFSLNSSEKSFRNKSSLKKNTADLSESQFEYLCIGSLENDLSSKQEAELRDIIESDTEKKKTFNVIQKTKLKPVALIFPYKKKLFKSAVSQRVIRYSFIGISAAATFALLFTIYQLIPHTRSENSKEGFLSVSSQIKKEESPAILSQKESFANNKTHPNNKILVNNLPKSNQIKRIVIASIHTNNAEIQIPDTSRNEKFFNTHENEIIPINISTVSTKINVENNILNNTLIAYIPRHIPPVAAEERSNVGRFIAKNFREIFLKEKTPSDTPLKGYEIAEVGVSGLNKLLGWEMALDKNNDANGDLKSVYFSSKILKFNALVKKNGPLQ